MFVGRPNARIADFHKWLIGTDDKPGFLSTLDLPHDKKEFSEETLRLFTHRLGFGHEETGYGCFSDDHESIENKADRNDRFCPEYEAYYQSSVHEFEYQGQVLDGDARLCDMAGNDLIKARVTVYTIIDAHGRTMLIDLGGLIPDGEGAVFFIVSHDESCFAAGDFENKVHTEHRTTPRTGSGDTGSFAGMAGKDCPQETVQIQVQWAKASLFQFRVRIW